MAQNRRLVLSRRELAKNISLGHGVKGLRADHPRARTPTPTDRHQQIASALPPEGRSANEILRPAECKIAG